MENPKICDCPYTNWCQKGRQSLQESFRKEDSSYKVENCDFYKIIKKHVENQTAE